MSSQHAVILFPIKLLGTRPVQPSVSSYSEYSQSLERDITDQLQHTDPSEPRCGVDREALTQLDYLYD